MRCFVHFDLRTGFAPQRCAIFRHLKFKKWYENVFFSAFWLAHVLFRDRNFKNGSGMWCFAHFHLQMCFAPQRHAIFPDRNFQNGSEHVVFCAFWLANVLRATAACHFPDRNFQNGSEHVVFCALWLQNVLPATAACHFSFLPSTPPHPPL